MITSVSVSTAETMVLTRPSGNAYRFVAIGNVGTNTAYIKLTPDPDAVTATNGIPLPSGTSILCDQDDSKELFKAPVTAICSSGTTTLSVQAY